MKAASTNEVKHPVPNTNK